MGKKLLVLANTVLAGVLLTLPATGAHAANVVRKYTYFPIYGKTAAELDHALSQNGPFLQKTGQHHPGATEIRFDAKVKYGKNAGESCKVQDIRVNVYAKISLPVWKHRSRAEGDIQLVWDTLLKDIRRHEESHIIIARTHANELERKVRALHSRKDCAELRKDIDRLTEKLLAEHDKAQERFDRVETINFEKRFERLLIKNLEKRKQRESRQAP
ncbi:DUF922 domain-containing Zn-dependent protease [Daeguia caeni]|uniref:DUF922 domain-containing Zn-dependent protease n=1 Tax=Daeguia caeni TaxID=439612 RepID=A0ABV9H443_9HYPH